MTIKGLEVLKKPERTVQDMISELFKKKYKKTMEASRTMESKLDLKKETATGLLSLQTGPKQKIEYRARATDLGSTDDNEAAQ